MTTFSLPSRWHIRHDPLSQGLTDGWRESPLDARWLEADVPEAWQRTLGTAASGVAWFRCDLPNAPATGRDARWVLRFEAVATDCWVWVNGVEVGRHVGDFIPFEFDITRAMNPGGRNHLTVRVDQVHAPRPVKGVVVEHGHITKGFHDVLSLQHAGIWDRVTLRQTGSCTIRPNGLFIDADPMTGRVRIEAELAGRPDGAYAEFTILDPDGAAVSKGELRPVGEDRLVGTAEVAAPRAWSPGDPALYALRLDLRNGAPPDQHVEVFRQRFGFRTVSTGGPNNSRILLNGNPLQIRGVLSWGHEPDHIAPAPPPAQVRAEFERFRAMGFNCVCLCMVYAPEHFYDIADETGMLLWQEHPVWKSRMSPDFVPEYKRLYAEFLRRDRRHPSVVIVSGTCEHEAFNAELGAWWRQTAVAMLPRTLAQIQTGFLEWTPPSHTDLYDDHVYDNPGRWVRFLHDMDSRIDELPPKPFVMGETIISNAWPDLAAFNTKFGDPSGSKPWWLSRGLAECEAFERDLLANHGRGVLDRFIAQAGAWGPTLRKFYAETLRLHPRNAGFVTNSVRDVPICRLGLMDDLGQWRFTPEQTRPWLAATPLLCRTPDHLRGFTGGESIKLEIGVSHFGVGDSDVRVVASLADQDFAHVRMSPAPGDISLVAVNAAIPRVDTPTLLTLAARSADLITNRWPIVALPDEHWPEGLSRFTGAPFTDDERKPEFEERAYSSGWGLPCRTWTPWLPDLASLAPQADTIVAGTPPDGRILLTHRLTKDIASFVRNGGRAVLLANRYKGGFETKWINLWGLLPLAIEGDGPWPIHPGESEALLALLMHDLTRNTTRAVHTEDLGISAVVAPIVRYVYTHDSGVPNLRDAAFAARAGRGLLVVSALDHSTPAGLWFLKRLARAAAECSPPKAELELERFVANAD